MSLYSLELPNELLEEIQQLAQTSQLSLDEWVLGAIALKMEAEKVHQFFQVCASKANFEQFDRVMTRVPDAEPLLGDELL